MRRRHAIVPGLLAVIGIAAAAPSPAQTRLRSVPESANGLSSVRLAAGGTAASVTFEPQGGPDTRSPLRPPTSGRTAPALPSRAAASGTG